jgi:hypothetical protein
MAADELVAEPGPRRQVVLNHSWVVARCAGFEAASVVIVEPLLEGPRDRSGCLVVMLGSAHFVRFHMRSFHQRW